MKKTILFDFDGTIANTLPHAVKITNNLLVESGYKRLSDEEFTDLRNMNPLQIVTHLKFPVWKLPGLIKHVRNGLSQKVEKIKLFPGMEQLIVDLKLKEHRLAILTTNQKEMVDKFLELNQLLMFDFIECEPNVFKKPKLLRSFLKKNNLKKSDVIYIGDEIRDIEACREVRIPIISVTWGFNKEEALKKHRPDYLVRKPQSIAKIIEQL